MKYLSPHRMEYWVNVSEAVIAEIYGARVLASSYISGPVNASQIWVVLDPTYIHVHNIPTAR